MNDCWCRRCGRLAVSVLIAGLAGCVPGGPGWSWQYALNAAGGELRYLRQAVPIEQGLQDPSLADEQREKLAFVIQARDYAEQVVGLNVGSSYRTFVNLNGQTLAWNLSASRKDAIEPYVWNLPIVGRIAYLGFFDHDELIAERDRLVGLGYDTFTYELDAFSTLGLLPDPVSSALLKRSLPNLADTVMHELLHNTVFVTRDEVFSESMATFVGRTAGLEFIEHEFGSDSPLLQQACDGYDDSDRINEFLRSIIDDARALYARDISSDEKIARREAVFEAARRRFTAEVQPQLHQPDRYAGYAAFAYNNAYLLVNVRYHSDMTIFSDVYENVGRDWSAALAVFRQAASSNDAFASLGDYLEQ